MAVVEEVLSLGQMQQAGAAVLLAAGGVAGYFFKTITSIQGRVANMRVQHEADLAAQRAAIDAHVETKLNEVWSAIDENETEARAYREKMLTRMNDIPTRVEMHTMKTDIMAAIDRAMPPKR